MPLSKLQQALKAQQSQASIEAAKRKSVQNKKNKEESLKHSSKEKRQLKRVRQAQRPAAVAEGTEAGVALEAELGRDDVVVAPEMSIPMPTASATAGSKKKRKGAQVHANQLPVVPFDKSDTILLLGEANFSFTRSLLSPPHSMPPHQLLATSYDTERECFLKYPDGEGIVTDLRAKGVKVEFKVDAGNLEKCKAVGKGRWSKVIFNFPHAGAGITDQERNILTNQHLLLRTLRSVQPVLTHGPEDGLPPAKSTSKGVKRRGKANNKRKRPESDDDDEEEAEEAEVEGADAFSDADPDLDDGDEVKIKAAPTPTLAPPARQGSILITLLNQPPYTLWSLPQLAQRPPPSCPGTRLPQPRYKLVRSFKFHPELYPGYAHRRTIGWREGKSKADNEEIVGRQGEARTWEFVRAAPKEQ